MQQSRQARFLFRAERRGEFASHLGNILQMVAQELPFSRGLRESLAVGVFRRVSVVNHARQNVGSRMRYTTGWDIGWERLGLFHDPICTVIPRGGVLRPQ